MYEGAFWPRTRELGRISLAGFFVDGADKDTVSKTFICLTLILASKNQYAFIPEEHTPPPSSHPSVPSLVDLAVASVWKNMLPWRNWTESLGENCVRILKKNHAFYEVPPQVRSRSKRYEASGNKERIYVGAGTIVVCPMNLVDQWTREVEDHVEKGQLKVTSPAVHVKNAAS
jgi:SNF2-related domain